MTEHAAREMNTELLFQPLTIASLNLLDGLRRLTDAVHAAGGLIMAHINHAGRAVNPKLVPEGERVSASDVFCPANQVIPRALTLEEIPAYVHYFAQAARRVREARFDAVEVPFSHGYLIHQFLSPHTNRRDDEYGGSFENRLRFGREVIAAVREAVGDDFPIVVRMNAQDYAEGGLTIEDAETLAPVLEGMGVNALSITSGTMCESVAYCLYPLGTPKAHLLPMSARIRQRVSIPVAVAGRGIRCIVVKRRPEIGGKLDPLARALLLRRLESHGVEVRTGVEVVRFETDEQGQTTVVARPWPHQAGASELRFPAETVVIGMGLRADPSLVEALGTQGGPGVHVVGDCLEPREALDAVWEGFEVGRTL